MFRSSIRTARRRSAVVAVGALLPLGALAGCGGGGDDEGIPADDSVAVDDSMPVKNRPLNNCVSVISGERPAPGVTVPRCVPTGAPTTMPPRALNPKSP